MMYRTKWLLAAILVVLGGNRIASAKSPACPKLPPLWRGALCLVAGRYDRTLAICDEVLHGDSDNRCAYVLRGYAHLSEKSEEQQAIADFSEALLRGPNNSVLHVARAEAYRNAKDYDRAIADCTEAIRIDPAYAEAYAWRGACYLAKRVTNKAIADYSLALRHNPNLTWARCGRGESYRRRGESARALADLEEALRNDPEDETAQYDRCLVYLMNLRDCDRVIAESSERIQRHPKEAVAIRLSPVDPDLYLRRGSARCNVWDCAGAIADYKKAVELAPEDAKAKARLAGVLSSCPDAHLHDGNKARKLATVACETTSWRDWVSLDSLAAACAECGDFADAVKWETKAGELAPDSQKSYIQKSLKLYRAHKPYRVEPPKGASVLRSSK